MKMLSCASTQRRLQAFHDQELPLEDQIAVSLHLEDCVGCSATLEDLQFVSSVVRAATRARAESAETDEVESFHYDEQAFQENVVGRLKAEDGESMGLRFQSMFEDMRLVYAGLGGGVAALACVVVMLNVMRLVQTSPNPDSLAATVRAMVVAETSQLTAESMARGLRVGSVMSAVPVTPGMIDARLLMPTASSAATYAADSDADVVLATVQADALALRAVVTREGRVAAVDVIRAGTGETVDSRTEEARALKKLIRAIQSNLYEPARVDGLPVASNKIWLLPHTTVHGRRASLDAAPTVPVDSKKPLTQTPSAPTGGRALRPV